MLRGTAMRQLRVSPLPLPLRTPVLLLLLLLLLATGAQSDDDYPRAPTQPDTLVVPHLEPQPDNYLYMRTDEAASGAYLAAERAHTERHFAPERGAARAALFGELQTALRRRLGSRRSEAAHSASGASAMSAAGVPAARVAHPDAALDAHGRALYTEPCGFFACVYRDEALLLNGSALAAAANSSVLALPALALSPDARTLAYLVDASGDEASELRLLRLPDNDTANAGAVDASGVAAGVQPLPYSGTAAPLECHERLLFLRDDALLCTALDGIYRQPLLVRELLLFDNATSASSAVLFEQTDARFAVDIRRTSSSAAVLIESQGQTTSDVRFVFTDDSKSKLHTLHASEPGVQMFADHVSLLDGTGVWLARTSRNNATNYALVASLEPKPTAAQWATLLPSADDVLLLDVHWQRRSHSLVLRRARNLEMEVCVARLRVAKRVDAPDAALSLSPLQCVGAPGVADAALAMLEFAESNAAAVDVARAPEPGAAGAQPAQSGTFGVTAQSLSEPPMSFQMLFDYDSVDTVHFRAEPTTKIVFDTYNSSAMHTWRTFAGEQAVPITVVQRRNQKPKYVLLMGYSAYASTWYPAFHTEFSVLLDRDFAVAICHARGSAARGMQWYNDGKDIRKQHSFDDVRSCTLHLVHELGLVKSVRHVALFGRSAGGLLMTSSALQWPDVGVALVQAPFVDVLVTMTDELAPWTVYEHDEWGDPAARQEIAEQMLHYGPYSLAAHTAPLSALSLPLFMQTGLNDVIVRPHEHARFAAAMRSRVGAGAPYLLQVIDAGHMGSSGQVRARDFAQQLAFVIEQLGARTAHGAAEPTGSGAQSPFREPVPIGEPHVLVPVVLVVLAVAVAAGLAFAAWRWRSEKMKFDKV